MSNLWLGRGAQYDSYGFVVSGSPGDVGTAISTSGFTQITASTTRDYEGIILNAYDNNNASEQTIDVAIGSSGSEQIICPKIRLPYTSNRTAITTLLPVAIPRGSRIACRSNGGVNPAVVIQGIAGVPLFDKGFKFCVAMGISSNKGTVISPNVSLGGGNYGSWTQLASSTSNNFGALLVAVGADVGSFIISEALLDIGIGSSGSQQEFIQGLIVDSYLSGRMTQIFYGPFLCDIPSGSTLWARMCSSANNSGTGANIDVSLYGFVR